VSVREIARVIAALDARCDWRDVLEMGVLERFEDLGKKSVSNRISQGCYIGVSSERLIKRTVGLERLVPELRCVWIVGLVA
jgi:hypothetical protein